jgi:hypothetical protein
MVTWESLHHKVAADPLTIIQRRLGIKSWLSLMLRLFFEAYNTITMAPKSNINKFVKIPNGKAKVRKNNNVFSTKYPHKNSNAIPPLFLVCRDSAKIDAFP